MGNAQAGRLMRRVRRPKKHEGLLQRLKGDEGPFDTLAEILTFAAAYGYASDAREPFSETNEAIDWEVFQNLGARSLVAMLAASTTDEIEILGDEHGDDRLCDGSEPARPFQPHFVP